MPVGSVDSGLGADMDDGRAQTRSSSEEKESLTPAQSRRKAQNRAAYVT
jgi:AP-1-like factor